ncbi:MAG: ABC transporter permease [Devosiaceae bacterium]|nr:ABC transporter permease [Devosiaceae bacterium MH13]
MADVTAGRGAAPSAPHVNANFALSFTYAMRELRGGLRGFLIFLACIALGVASISGVNALAQSMTGGLANEGRGILGGDIALELIQREASRDEMSFLQGQGASVTTMADLRGMARSGDEQNQTVVEIKAVEPSYPLVSGLTFDDGSGVVRDDPHAVLAPVDGVYGLLIESTLAARLDVGLGDVIRIGEHAFALRGTIISEPDRLSSGFGFGPRALMSLDGLETSALIQPGSLVEWEYRLAWPEPLTEPELEAFTAAANEAHPDAGWRLRDRTEASPQLSRAITQFAQFLTLVGLTALVVGGVGVANAVRAFVEAKRKVIATFKSLGAAGPFVFRVQFFQVMAIAGLGIAIGLVIGAAVPFLVQAIFGDLLPVPLETRLYPGALALAALYGVLVALAFALWPLGTVRDVPATALFRDVGGSSRRLPRWLYMAGAGAAMVGLGVVAFLVSDNRFIASIYLAAAGASFVILRVVGWVVMAVAKRSPRPKATAAKLAIGNIHRPGALTPSVILSLGLGLTLLVALALIDANLRRQLTGSIPEVAPSFFFLDIQNSQIDGFRDLVSDAAPDATLETVPILRGRLVALQGIPAAEFEAPPEASWVLRGDRGITYEEAPPEGTVLTEGEWWPEDYAGEPLVSFIEEEGRALGLAIGDPLTVNVLGREVTARIANFREVEWQSLDINFVMVFSPNTFAGAPHAHLATVTYPEQPPDEVELSLLRQVTAGFPGITSVRISDALDAVNALVEDLALAVRGAASITLIASVLVLAGALAAGHRHRLYDAVILKTLGATRGRILTAFLLEYALLGLAAAVFGLGAGTLAAFAVLEYVMSAGFTFLPSVAFGAVGVALVLTVGLGLAGTWRILGQKPAPVLRNL